MFTEVELMLLLSPSINFKVDSTSHYSA